MSDPEDLSEANNKLRTKIDHMLFNSSMGECVLGDLRVVLNEYSEQTSKIIAQTYFTVEFKTACGATRTEILKGRLSREYRVPLRKTHCDSWIESSDMAPSIPKSKERVFELIEMSVKDKTATYREVVE